MFGEKLITLLLGFDKYTLNRLRKFLLSPFFNEQQDVVDLFEHLNAVIRRGESALQRLDAEDVWAVVYPGIPFDEMQLRRLTSELTQLTLRFLAVQQWLAGPYAAELTLQPLLNRPETAKHLAGVERRLERTLEERKHRMSVEDYQAAYTMYWNMFSQNTGVLSTTGYAGRLVPADYALDCLYAIQKLKFYVAWLLYRHFRTAPDQLPVMDGFWAFVSNPRFDKESLLVLYRQGAQALEHFGDETYYRTFVQHLERHNKEIDSGDLRELYQLAQNYCAMKINQGHTAYYQEVFLLYRKLISTNLLLADGQLSEGLYKNIITAGLRVGEYAWAEQFIQEYAEKLPANIRENARTFNLANLYSHQKRYDKVIELLRNVEYSDVVYALSAKLILVRTYYESNEWNALDSLIDSFRIYLQRNKLISKSVKNQYSQFLRFVRRLISLRPGDAEGREFLRRQIAGCEPLMSKQWLLEKTQEIHAGQMH